jgi:hypothetical protein
VRLWAMSGTTSAYDPNMNSFFQSPSLANIASSPSCASFVRSLAATLTLSLVVPSSFGCGGRIDLSASGPDMAPGALPKKPTGASPTTRTTARYFAIRQLLFGDKQRDGSLDPQAWRSYGQNIDGLFSTRGSVPHCTLATGSIPRFAEDGIAGIDNAFGFGILPVLLAADPELTRFNQAALEAGDETLILEVVGLDSSPSQTNTGLSGQLLFATKAANAPKWDGTDVRTIAPESLNDGTLEGGSKTPFSEAYVSSGTFVATAPRAALGFRFGGGRMRISLSNATLSFNKPVSADGKLKGTLSGVLPFGTLEADFRRQAGSFFKELCEERNLSFLAEQVGHGRDILSDGTNRSGVACDALSAGFGFEANEIQPPTRVGDASPPEIDLCPSR